MWHNVRPFLVAEVVELTKFRIFLQFCRALHSLTLEYWPPQLHIHIYIFIYVIYITSVFKCGVRDLLQHKN